ncbi:uncharacterized protein BT62DRAFT_921000 [Guyanagaster necrorhizus]|uniref:Uncharacterized protein n=1 Tax=Guyanagaster necrorhizus TaxID=856835 RepID=A0A9P8AQU4_9AGAR|nr:uncharacterized protein BT62DRAFT_921000 [Guyanagaster necrorhizus MCA 3950]KAG7444708.1 hypothetical protein BT62DRAFT_921000 [Guyanagaster necrorhizus MCA 3950]
MTLQRPRQYAQIPPPGGTVFVPAFRDTPPQYQLHANHNNANASPDFPALVMEIYSKMDSLKQHVEDRNRVIAELKGENVDLQRQVTDLQGQITELERRYEVIHGWLSDDTEYMDRIRLRHILDRGPSIC